MDEQLQHLDKVTDAVFDMGLKFGPRVLTALIILAAGYFAGRWAARALGRTLNRMHLEPPVKMLIERIVRLFVFALFAIMALQNLGVELLPLIAGLGVAGAGIALAMQGVLGNVVAGLTIIFSRPFRVGDYISIVKEEGEVLEISVFNTVLGHSDLSKVVIPNRKIVGEILHNYGRIRQLNAEVVISYEADVETALSAVREILERNPKVLRDPKAGINVAKLGDSGITIGINPWVSAPDTGPATSEINQAVVAAFRARGVVIASPQREVRVVSSTAVLSSERRSAA
jgi:small conductance mechanosensitive channel